MGGRGGARIDLSWLNFKVPDIKDREHTSSSTFRTRIGKVRSSRGLQCPRISKIISLASVSKSGRCVLRVLMQPGVVGRRFSGRKP